MLSGDEATDGVKFFPAARMPRLQPQAGVGCSHAGSARPALLTPRAGTPCPARVCRGGSANPGGPIACPFEQRQCGHTRHEGAVRVAVDVDAELSGPECRGASSVAGRYPAFCAILRQRLRGYVVR